MANSIEAAEQIEQAIARGNRMLEMQIEMREQIEAEGAGHEQLVFMDARIEELKRVQRQMIEAADYIRRSIYDE